MSRTKEWHTKRSRLCHDGFLLSFLEYALNVVQHQLFIVTNNTKNHCRHLKHFSLDFEDRRFYMASV